MDRTIKNAKIERVSIDTERFLSSWVHLDFGGSGQGFGGYHLGGPAAAAWIAGILDTLEVEKWEDLPGTVVRADHDWGKVYRIGHALKERWFDPEVAFEPIRAAARAK